jgi:hypothetical protein
MTLSLQAVKNRLARLNWLPDVTCVITLDSQCLDAAKKFFFLLYVKRLIEITDEELHRIALNNFNQFKAIIPQRHLLDSIAAEIGKYAQDIRLCSQMRLHSLLTRRKEKQEEFARTIIGECLTSKLLEELAAWNVGIIGRLETNLYGDIPVILFQLLHAGERICDIALDGWSGLLLVDGAPRFYQRKDPKVFSQPEDFQKTAIEEMNAYFEDITG